jgi:hypothetical protein
MRKMFFSLLVSLLLFPATYAGKSIVVTNNTGYDRKDELVEVKISALKINPEKESYLLKTSAGAEVPYQLIYGGGKTAKSIIFQANVKAKSVSTYILSAGKPAPVEPKTFARFVPERKDDFAWENDIAAYRMYGPALAKENPSNGVDIWMKSTDKLVVDQRYRDELQNGLSYHIDRGNGLDCYKVGHTLGAGGIAPYADGKVWVGNYFNSYKVIEPGPLRSVFTLTYDSVVVGKNVYKQTITITANAGSILNKGVVKYEGIKQPMKLAGGIFLHDGKGKLIENPAKGFIAYAEEAVSDAGLPAGRNYIAVVVPKSATEVNKDKEHSLILANYIAGTEFTYFFGGGWSKGGFPADADWFKTVARFANNLKNPLVVTVK